MNSIRWIAVPAMAVVVACLPLVVRAQAARHVDPFLGTMGDGNVFPGPSRPWGFVQVGPDTGPGSQAAGYKFDRNINGFSQQRVSGMGGPLYGQISLLPITGDVGDLATLASTGKSDERASVGYYAVTLAPWDTRVELTCDEKVAFQKQTFPAGDAARIVIDVSHCLYGREPGPKGGSWSSGYPVDGNVTVTADGKEVSGEMTYKGGRSTGKAWKVYFVTRIDTAPASVGTWGDDCSVVAGRRTSAGKQIGVVLTYDTVEAQSILTRTAVSWRSLEQARRTLDVATPSDFAAVRDRAAQDWEEKLSKIKPVGGSDDDLTRFYTALYRAHLSPNNWTGESPSAYGDLTYYENHLCMWDQFRTLSPLMALIQPKVQSDIVNSIINFHKIDGWTGDAHSAHQFEHVQNGSNADVIIADAYVKDLPGIDWADAYAAVRKNAFVDRDPRARYRPQFGRFRLEEYRRLGYLPSNADDRGTTQGVSRTLEYVHNDFSVLQLAKKHGSTDDVADLTQRAQWYRNLWDQSSGGFMRGKTSAGTWFEPFDPVKAETGKQYYEGHAWTWSWYVPHDVQGLIDLLGGDDAFVAKLTTACEKYYEAYNEPCMLQTYLFTHAGRPDLTQRFARGALRHFKTTKAGLPGNDDSGTTSAWLVWTMLGLYPNSGQPYYYVGSPVFPEARIDLGDGRAFVIKANRVDAANLYVQSATLNGTPLTRAWLTHAQVTAGGDLVLEMGPQPSDWAKAGDRPPSMTDKP